MTPMQQLITVFTLLGLKHTVGIWSGRPAVFLSFGTDEVDYVSYCESNEYSVDRHLIFSFKTDEDGTVAFAGLYAERA